MSADLQKSSECLRHWGAGEGDDLQDTLGASATLLAHFAQALSQLSTHEVAIREHMKAVRTREENLDELKRRRKQLSAKAESAERTLSKMGPEVSNFSFTHTKYIYDGVQHKKLQQQTELLNNLREQIRNMDWEILSDEARYVFLCLPPTKLDDSPTMYRLGDFKRSSAKNWQAAKFGGILECAEKTTIIGELGKLVIEVSYVLCIYGIYFRRD